MANMANLLLKKDDGTDVTYLPIAESPSLFWRTNVSGVGAGGQSSVTIQRDGKLKNGGKRTNVKLSLPVMEIIPSGTVNNMGYQAAPKVAGSVTLSLTVYEDPCVTNEVLADALRQFAHLMIGGRDTSGGGVSPMTVTADTYRDAVAGYIVPFGIVNGIWPN